MIADSWSRTRLVFKNAVADVLSDHFTARATGCELGRFRAMTLLSYYLTLAITSGSIIRVVSKEVIGPLP